MNRLVSLVAATAATAILVAFATPATAGDQTAFTSARAAIAGHDAVRIDDRMASTRMR